MDNILPRGAIEWEAPGDHLIEQYAQAEDVSALVHRQPASLFWRHIWCRAQHQARFSVRGRGTERRRDRGTGGRRDREVIDFRSYLSVSPSPRPSVPLSLHRRVSLSSRRPVALSPRQKFGDAEIKDLEITVRAHHHVFRFYVAVDNPRRVRDGQGVSDLSGYVERPVQRQRRDGHQLA